MGDSEGPSRNQAADEEPEDEEAINDPLTRGDVEAPRTEFAEGDPE